MQTLVPILLALLPAQADEDDAPPVGAAQIAGEYKIEAQATPTTLAVEEPLVLTVRITGKGPEKYQPRRAELDDAFRDGLGARFHFEPLPEKDGKSGDTWVFVYRLKPKSTDVKFVPGLKMTYYDLGRKREVSAYSKAVALTVRPRKEAAPPAEVIEILEAPGARNIITGPAVRDRVGLGILSQPAVLAALAILPPVACLCWYWLWRRRHPDARKAAKRQRHRAAHEALHALQQQMAAPESLADVMAGYLRHRLDLRGAEPTPDDVGKLLQRQGVSRPVRASLVDFFRTCDAARFSPGALVHAGDLNRRATDIIHALEAEPCLERVG